MGVAIGQGDAVALELVREGGRQVGSVLANLVSFFNPGLIVIGGGVAGLGHPLLAEIRSVIYRQSLPLATGNLPVVLSQLGGDAGRSGRPGWSATRCTPRIDNFRKLVAKCPCQLSLSDLSSSPSRCDGRHPTTLEETGSPGPQPPEADPYGSASPADRPLLEMRGIVKRFPGVLALDGVDLTVRPGEVHCLLGQNGAGKSTLIKVLAGAHRPDEGEITWLGEPVVLGTRTRRFPWDLHHLPGARPRRRPERG